LICECTKYLGVKAQLVQLVPVWALRSAFTEITRKELPCTLAHTHTLIHLRNQLHLLGALAILQKPINSFVVSVCPSSWKSSAPTGRIFMKLCIWILFRKCCEKNSSFIKKSEKITDKAAVPLQSWTGSEGSRRLRLPHFKTVGTWRW
jgi:hypothetical protein